MGFALVLFTGQFLCHEVPIPTHSTVSRFLGPRIDCIWFMVMWILSFLSANIFYYIVLDCCTKDYGPLFVS